jgi:hypothetical protein
MGKPCTDQTQQKNPIIIEEKQQVKQPVMVIPLPSPYCNQNWNYNSEGTDWNCKCSEGYQQSPIPLKNCKRILKPRGVVGLIYQFFLCWMQEGEFGISFAKYF